jgi:hypothetical protein
MDAPFSHILLEKEGQGRSFRVDAQAFAYGISIVSDGSFEYPFETRQSGLYNELGAMVPDPLRFFGVTDQEGAALNTILMSATQVLRVSHARVIENALNCWERETQASGTSEKNNVGWGGRVLDEQRFRVAERRGVENGRIVCRRNLCSWLRRRLRNRGDNRSDFDGVVSGNSLLFEEMRVETRRCCYISVSKRSKKRVLKNRDPRRLQRDRAALPLPNGCLLSRHLHLRA